MRSKFGTFAKTANFHAFTPFDQTLNCKLNPLLHLDALADAPSLTPKQLATKYGDEAARWAQLQLELRKRATKKFGELATRMLFEREALEQATSLGVARYHASQFPQGVPVIDLTAGLGGDTLALAERGPVVAYESDHSRAQLLENNLNQLPYELTHWGFTSGDSAKESEDRTAHILIGDGATHLINKSPDLPKEAYPAWGSGYLWADPDRRSDTGRRLTKPEDYTPNPTDLAIKLKDSKLAGIKLSPLLPDDYLESLGGSLEFISHQGECLEAIIWLGTENAKPKRQAVILHPNQDPTRIEASTDYLQTTDTPQGYIHDCDPAVVRAHCLSTFGHQHLGDSPGYLTSDDPTPNPAYKTYKVIASPTKNQLKAELQKIGGKVFELKQRGANLDPTKLLKEIKTNGDSPISLVAFRVGNSIRYALTERLG